LEFEFLILLLEHCNLLLKWDLVHCSRFELDSSGALDEPSDEVGHLSLLNLTISILIELFEEDIELVNCDCWLALQLHELIQEVESLQLVESSTVVGIVPSPDGVDESIGLIIGLVAHSHFSLDLLYGLILVFQLALQVTDLSILLSQL